MDLAESLKNTAAMSTLCNIVPATVFEIKIGIDHQVIVTTCPEPVVKTESQKMLEYFLGYTAESVLVRSPRPEKPLRLILVIDARGEVTVHDMTTA